MKDKETSMKRAIVAVLVAGALVLSAAQATLAAGKMGGASGFDRAPSTRLAMAGGKIGGGPDRPVTQGGKSGVDLGSTGRQDEHDPA